VVLEDVKDGIASARITQVFQASPGSIRQGNSPKERLRQRVLLKYNFTSCGPNHQVGEKGTIFAKLSVNKKGEITLYPYLRRYGDGRIFPPRM
jgi:hypothetical protein